MADEVTQSGLDGTLSFEYWLMRESIVSALYDVLTITPYVINRNLAGVASNAARFPKMPKLSASALMDGTDIPANTAFSPTSSTLTVGESGLMIEVSDLAEMGGIVGLQQYGAEAGRAVAEKITGDLVALGAGFSTSVGTTNTDLTEAFILNANATLRGANVPGPYIRLLHPDSYYKELIGDIGTTFSALANTGSGVRAESNDLPAAGDNGVVGNLLGAFTVLSSQVGEDGNSDKENAQWSRDRALGYVTRWDVRVEFERNASKRTTEVVVTAAYATGEIDDTSGVRIVSDGA